MYSFPTCCTISVAKGPSVAMEEKFEFTNKKYIIYILVLVGWLVEYFPIKIDFVIPQKGFKLSQVENNHLFPYSQL